jgi:hypothetical protein
MPRRWKLLILAKEYPTMAEYLLDNEYVSLDELPANFYLLLYLCENTQVALC